MKSGMTTLNLHQLDVACIPVWAAFQNTYLVGTAETGGEYRDVDVRTILDDSEFDLLFGDDNGPHRWELMCVSIGLLLAQQTGLPIDYQIQRMSEANAKYDGPRNPVGRKRNFAAFGDATPWTPKPPYEQPSPEVDISKSPVCTCWEPGLPSPDSPLMHSYTCPIRQAWSRQKPPSPEVGA